MLRRLGTVKPTDDLCQQAGSFLHVHSHTPAPPRPERTQPRGKAMGTLDGLNEAQLIVALDVLAHERRHETDPDRRAALVVEADAVLDALNQLEAT